MANKKHSFAPGEIFHCYNRGVEKRKVFCDQQDYVYFLKSLRAYNSEEVSGKLRLQENKSSKNPPVTILAYCLLPNHFHLVLRSNTDQSISKYFQRLSGGYTMYFNQKYSRSGGLFQGTFKSVPISSNQSLRQVLAYVYFNNLIHDVNDNSLFRNSLNTSDKLVRGLTSNLEDYKQNFSEVVKIIEEMRTGLE
jgi:putative transposase